MKKLTGSLFSLLFLASCGGGAYTIDEDIPTVLNPIANDSDIDDDPLTITNAHASHGQVTLGENNTLGFKPKPDFNGTDKAFYTLADNHQGTATGEITITINAVNDAPRAKDDTFVMKEDNSDTFDVLSNDIDPDGDPITITNVEATNGEASINETVMIIVEALDIDLNDLLNFSITAGNTDAIFAIDESSGQITVANRTFLDFETIPAYILTVTVTDSGQLTATATVNITIENGTENEVAVADTGFCNGFFLGSTVGLATALLAPPI
jgi:hypothetical protein